MTTPLSAIVLDDHPLVARGISDFLVSHCSFKAVKTITQSRDLWLNLTVAHVPSLIVIDFWLADGAVLDIIAKLRSQFSQVPVLVMSADDNNTVERKACLAGAAGFILKQEAPLMFAEAVKSIIHGESWFQGKKTSTLSDSTLKEMPTTAEELGLTVRQGEVLALVLKGLPNKRIAQHLAVSEQTVKEHISGILNRLGVTNRIEAITKLRGKKFE